MSSFGRGFRNRNPLVLLAAAALLAPALLGIESLFTSGAWSAVPMQRWMRNANDDYMFVSWTVASLKREPPERPLVVLLGGSSGREAIDGGDVLAGAVAGAGGPPVAAYNLSSRMQRFAQSWAVVDNLPDTPTTVLIGVNLGRFTTSPRSNFNQVVGRELLLKSDSLREYVVRSSGEHRRSFTILPGIFTAFTSYAQERERDLTIRKRLGPPPYRRHAFDRRKPLTAERKQELVQKWLDKQYPAFRKVHEFNLELFDALVARARERGLDVVVVELPYNREVIGAAFDEPREAYQGPVREIAAAHGVPYLDFNDRAAIPSDYFLDLSHLLPRGREIWEAELARELVRLYGDGAIRGSGT